LNTDAGMLAIADPRLRASEAALAAPYFGVEQARRHLRSHLGGGGGWTVCMHVDGFEATTASVIAELPEGRRPIARFSLGWPCRSVFVPLLVGHPLGDVLCHDDFARFTLAEREMLDRLEADLERDVLVAAAVDDPGWNAEAWGRVGAVLGAR